MELQFVACDLCTCLLRIHRMSPPLSSIYAVCYASALHHSNRQSNQKKFGENPELATFNHCYIEQFTTETDLMKSDAGNVVHAA